jgi:hypothetical protein
MAFEAARIVDDLEPLRELLGPLDDLPASEVTPSLRGQQARFRARLPEHDSEAEYATAEHIFRDAEMPFYLAATQLEHAEWLVADGRPAEAEPLLAEARATFEQLRARPWLERMEGVVGRRPSAAV